AQLPQPPGASAPATALLGAAPGPARALSDEERRVMVELHNLYRAQASPAAANMLRMSHPARRGGPPVSRGPREPPAFCFSGSWAPSPRSPAPSASAEPGRPRLPPAELGRGAGRLRQGLRPAVRVGPQQGARAARGEPFAIMDEGVDVPLAVREWHVEREHYNFSAATCARGQMCGHYTQVVWAKTERIGCGSHFCEKLQGVEETNIHLLVCNYEPPGNVKGHRPYQEGTPCSQCPSGYRCENSLCEPMSSPEEAQELPHLVTETSSSLATEASGSRKGGIASSLATETSSFLVTEVSGPLSTKALPTIETKAPSSLATEGPSSMATEAPLPQQLSSFRFWKLTARSPWMREQLPPPNRPMIPPQKGWTKRPARQKCPPRAQRTLRTSRCPRQGHKGCYPTPRRRARLRPSCLRPEEPDKLPATLDHTDHISKSLPNFPNTAATANATGGRTLALQSSLPGAEDPERPEVYSELASGSGHIWGPLLALLLLPPLVLAGIF
ncbi:hypothetical protein QTO34_001587, partial [Cnephaeus nilssonii]